MMHAGCSIGLNGMDKPKIILLCGPPCSGKSTWIQNHNVENLSVLSTDDFIEEKAKQLNTTYDVIWGDSIQPAVIELAKQLRDFTQRNESFIVDQTNVNFKSRRKKLHLCENYYKIAVYFEVPLETLLVRNTQRPGKVIPQSVIETMLKAYRRPTIEEGFDLIIDGAENLTGT